VLSSKEQMEIIKGALAEDYRGPIYKLIEQATINKQAAAAQEEQQSEQRETGGLVKSYESQPPSLENLPTGDKIGKSEMLEDASRYDEGGLKGIGSGVFNSDGDVVSRVSKGAYQHRRVAKSVYASLDFQDAALEYGRQLLPKNWFDGKSASQAAYNELVPINIRMTMEDAQDNMLFNKDNPIGKFSPLSYLPRKIQTRLGYKKPITEKDLSKGELELLTKIVEKRKEQTDSRTEGDADLNNRILDYSDYGKNLSIQNTNLYDKITNPNLILKTTIGYGNVEETDTGYTLTDTFDFNQNLKAEKMMEDGLIADNPYNQLRWTVAPKYLSKGGEGIPVAINIDKQPEVSMREGGFIDRKVLYSKVNDKKITKRKRKK
tara:strand:+ start:3744 stop:4871 length:1128 start_codon:yes stop_codon:yes gene_type:complete